MTRRFSRPTLDDEIYGQLVDQLFGTAGALVAAAGGSLALAGAGILLEDGTATRACFVLVGVACLARAFVLFAYKRDRGTLARPVSLADRARMRRWEACYAITAIGWMAAIGCDAYVEMGSRDVQLQLLASILAMGLTGGIAARNASRPWIIKLQAVAVLGPYGGALLRHGGVAHASMMLMSVLMFAGVVSAAESINRMLLSAMETARQRKLLTRRLDTALNSMSHGLVMFDAACRVEVVNAKFAGLLGIAEGAIVPGLPHTEVVRHALAGHARPRRSAQAYGELFGERIRSREPSELLLRTSAGAYFDFKFDPTFDGGTVITMEDVSEKRSAAARIERLAHYDELTNLPNRAMFKEMLAALVAEPAAQGRFAIHFLDLDNFKQVNDTLGHPTGDALLALASARIKSAIRPEDFCARLAGDEFVVVQKAVTSQAAAAALASRLIEVASHPYAIDGHEVTIGVSIGILTHAAAGTGAEDLLKHADLALYCAKQSGKGTFCFFEPAMSGEAIERRNLEQDLRAAIRAEELDVYFQPIVDLHGGTIASYEALVRWHHPLRGTVLPDAFIRLAEDCGLIVELGALVLRKACRAAMAWPPATTVSVNLSVVQFRKAVVLRQIVDALAATGLPSERLEVEVTESLALDNLSVTRDLVGQIRALGVRIALDDFGTGYSSLAYLQQIPFDKIKIDRSFVRDLHESEMSRALLKLMSAFARSLDKTLVVEGVETTEQATWLADIGVRQMQGYLFGRAQPADRLGALQARAMTAFVPAFVPADRRVAEHASANTPQPIRAIKTG